MDRYVVEKLIGTGAYAYVHLALDTHTGSYVALKEIALDEDFLIGRNILRESSILYDMNHPNIVRLERVFIHEQHVYLVLEHLSNSLRQHMTLSASLYPMLAERILKQLLSGTCYCHSLGIMHRDLKPENLLVAIENDKLTLKIADFGLARGLIAPDTILTPEVVPLTYRAPELLDGADVYTFAVDMWAIGCIFAEMLMKRPLFEGELVEEVRHEILNTLDELAGFREGNKNVKSEKLVTLVSENSSDTLDLLLKLLTFDPACRISASDALQHSYFKA